MAPGREIKGRPKSMVSRAYGTVTAPENASVVRSVTVFAVAVAFLNSGFAEFLIPG